MDTMAVRPAVAPHVSEASRVILPVLNGHWPFIDDTAGVHGVRPGSLPPCLDCPPSARSGMTGSELGLGASWSLCCQCHVPAPRSVVRIASAHAQRSCLHQSCITSALLTLHRAYTLPLDWLWARERFLPLVAVSCSGRGETPSSRSLVHRLPAVSRIPSAFPASSLPFSPLSLR
jgi:hypothetical protein